MKFSCIEDMRFKDLLVDVVRQQANEISLALFIYENL